MQAGLSHGGLIDSNRSFLPLPCVIPAGIDLILTLISKIEGRGVHFWRMWGGMYDYTLPT